MEHKHEISGIVTDIAKFALHDGPGIRTIVFFKGCPLRCKWCQNPETWSRQPEMMHFADQCIGCGNCIQVCPQKALSADRNGLHRDTSRCTRCGACARACNTGAMKVSGRRMTVTEVMEEVLKDRIFYEISGGGLTLSGGECTAQPAFAEALLREAKKEGLHTAMETCGFCDADTFARIIRNADLLLFDVKVPVSAKSRIYTGRDFEPILRNLRNARQAGKKVILRYPLIPGVNDDPATRKIIGSIASENDISMIHILPFHQMGSNKWNALDRAYDFRDREVPEEEKIEQIRNDLENGGVRVCVGGSQY